MVLSYITHSTNARNLLAIRCAPILDSYKQRETTTSLHHDVFHPYQDDKDWSTTHLPELMIQARIVACSIVLRYRAQERLALGPHVHRQHTLYRMLQPHLVAYHLRLDAEGHDV